MCSSDLGSLRASGEGSLAALTGGYHVAFLVGSVFALAAAAVGATLLRTAQPAPAHHHVGATAEVEC